MAINIFLLYKCKLMPLGKRGVNHLLLLLWPRFGPSNVAGGKFWQHCELRQWRMKGEGLSYVANVRWVCVTMNKSLGGLLGSAALVMVEDGGWSGFRIEYKPMEIKLRFLLLRAVMSRNGIGLRCMISDSWTRHLKVKKVLWRLSKNLAVKAWKKWIYILIGNSAPVWFLFADTASIWNAKPSHWFSSTISWNVDLNHPFSSAVHILVQTKQQQVYAENSSCPWGFRSGILLPHSINSAKNPAV